MLSLLVRQGSHGLSVPKARVRNSRGTLAEHPSFPGTGTSSSVVLQGVDVCAWVSGSVQACVSPCMGVCLCVDVGVCTRV